MCNPPSVAVLGVDACRGGWIGLRLDDDSHAALFAPTIEALVGLAGAVGVVAIDIPIGLPVAAPRMADTLARTAVGPRWRSVFLTPPRAVLEASSYADANALLRRLWGAGLTRQSYGLRQKIVEVNAWIDQTGMHAVEVHPEVSFRILAGTPLGEPKSSWAGFQLRRSLLADVGLGLHGDLGLAGCPARPDDVLDAAVAAWTARRVERGDASPLPDPPEDLDGVEAAIWA